MEWSKETVQAVSRDDEQFRRWSNEHRQYEERLAQLARKATLSAEEELEEKQLKKKKLHIKDQMAAKLRGYESSRSVSA